MDLLFRPLWSFALLWNGRDDFLWKVSPLHFFCRLGDEETNCVGWHLCKHITLNLNWVEIAGGGVLWKLKLNKVKIVSHCLVEVWFLFNFFTLLRRGLIEIFVSLPSSGFTWQLKEVCKVKLVMAKEWFSEQLQFMNMKGECRNTKGAFTSVRKDDRTWRVLFGSPQSPAREASVWQNTIWKKWISRFFSKGNGWKSTMNEWEGEIIVRDCHRLAVGCQSAPLVLPSSLRPHQDSDLTTGHPRKRPKKGGMESLIFFIG